MIETNDRLASARVRLSASAARTREANHALCDIDQFDERVRRGALAEHCGLGSALALGGLADLKFDRESVDDVREALRAYAEWLLAVADKAA